MTEIKMWFERDEIVQNPRESMDNMGTIVAKHGRYRLGDKDASYQAMIESILDQKKAWTTTSQIIEAVTKRGIYDEYLDYITERAPIGSSRKNSRNSFYDFFFNCFGGFEPQYDWGGYGFSWHEEFQGDSYLAQMLRQGATIIPLTFDEQSAQLKEGYGRGFVGVCYCTHQQGREEYPNTRGLGYIKKVESYLRNEIETYNDWASGNIYRCHVQHGDDYCHSAGEVYGSEFKDRKVLKSTLEGDFDSQFHPYIDEAIDKAIAEFAL